MTRPLPAPARDERGFILVGVVMFMIALTILGLSLFALSSYEAQFFYASQSREQSLQSSESGMEVVKVLLSAPPYTLESAQAAVGQFGITRALAYQARSGDPNDTTSSGPVNWDSTLVIVVTARAGSEERTVESRFVPMTIKSPYHQLISCGQDLTYNLMQGSSRTMELYGSVWQPIQSSGDSTWTNYVHWRSGRPIDPSAPPTVMGNKFVDANRLGVGVGGPTYMKFDKDDTPYEIELYNNNKTASPKFFVSPPSPPPDNGPYPENSQYEFFSEHELTIQIHGTVIWLVNQGVCFRRPVTVVPDANDPGVPNVLVIVAKPNLLDPAHPNRGIWFEGGLSVSDSTQTKVFLVSQGDISFTQDHSGHTDLNAQAVTIVAGGDVELMGPDSATWEIAHAASMDAIADDLLLGQYLPAASGGSGVAFAFAQHSWLETRLP